MPLHEHAALLKGRSALVTGAQQGIGFAFAEAWAAQEPYRLYCADLAAGAELEALMRKNSAVRFIHYDQGKLHSIESLFASIAKDGNGLYAAAMSAIYSDRQRLLDADPLGMQKTIDVSLTGGIFVLQAALNLIVKTGRGGRAVLVGSPHADPSFAVPTCLAYNSVKAGMLQAMRTAATEMVGYEPRITVNEVVPGWTDTKGERKFQDDAAILRAVQSMPARRLITPAEVANVGTIFLHPEMEMVNGQRWGITGSVDLPTWSCRDREGGV